MLQRLLIVAAAFVLSTPAIAVAQTRLAFARSGGGGDQSRVLLNDTERVSTLDRGRYMEAEGFDNDNFATGFSSEGERRSFFAFSGLTNFAGEFTAVRLELFNCCTAPSPYVGFDSPNPSEIIDLFDVAVPFSVLGARTEAVSTFADLGTGKRFGSATVSSADIGRYVIFELNADGIAAFEAARTGNGEVAIGARMRTSAVPEPATGSLLAAGIAAMLVARRRRARA